MGFNPRDFMSLEDAMKQSAMPASTAPPPAPTWKPNYAPSDAYSTTVMPETGAPGPNRSLAGNRNYTDMGTANDLANYYGGRTVLANNVKGPTSLSSNANQFAIDFGVGDPLNAGQLASRLDTSDPTRDKFWDSPYWRDKSVQDELNYAAKYNPGAAPRSPEMFGNNPAQNQFSVPTGGANALGANGKSSFLKAPLTVQGGAGLGAPGQARTPAPTAQSQMSATRTASPGSLYGGNQARQQMRPASSPYGAPQAQPKPAAPQQQMITSAYRPVGVSRTF